MLKLLQPQTPYSKLPFSFLNRSSRFSVSNPAVDFVLDEIELHKSLERVEKTAQFTPKHVEPKNDNVSKVFSGLQASHPWPEWVELMEQLVLRGYFRPDEVGIMGGKEYNLIRTSCLNFARDNGDLLRFFSRKYIRVLAGSGCPSVERKVVNSGKRLREYAGVDEGNVCSSCVLRGNCDRAFMKAHRGEGVNSVDVMRLLTTYGLELAPSSVDNRQSLNINVLKSVKRCNFNNSSRMGKCVACDGLIRETPSELEANQDHILKTGDWICFKCNFLIYAKNTRCLNCKEKPPMRLLNPGEWECDSCNYINFRRNYSCMKCDHKRAKALYNAQASD